MIRGIKPHICPTRSEKQIHLFFSHSPTNKFMEVFEESKERLPGEIKFFKLSDKNNGCYIHIIGKNIDQVYRLDNNGKIIDYNDILIQNAEKKEKQMIVYEDQNSIHKNKGWEILSAEEALEIIPFFKLPEQE